MDMNYGGGECGREGGGQDGVEWGGKWDNCNSIINKYIKKNLSWFLREMESFIMGRKHPG